MSEKKKGLFARLREGLSKTRGNLTEKVDDMVRENRKYGAGKPENRRGLL